MDRPRSAVRGWRKFVHGLLKPRDGAGCFRPGVSRLVGIVSGFILATQGNVIRYGYRWLLLADEESRNMLIRANGLSKAGSGLLGVARGPEG